MVKVCAIRKDTNQLLNQLSLIKSACVFSCLCVCLLVCAWNGTMRLCLMSIDVWKRRAAGSRQDGGREKKRDEE